MCEPWVQTSLFDAAAVCPTSSSEARLARTPAPPTPAGAVSTASAPDCSSRPSGSSTNAALFGARLRTRLAFELAATTGSRPRWKRSATPQKRSWWVLETSAPRICDNGCGSLLPTPVASAASRGSVRQDGKAGRDLRAALLPTPTATEYGSNQGGANGRTGTVRPSLRTLLTPTTNGKAEHRLRSIVGASMPDNRRPTLATPTARDWRSGKASETTHARNSRHLSEQLGRQSILGTAALLGISEWLMGLPPGWLASACLITSAPAAPSTPPAPASPPKATRSSRRSPRRSDDPCGT